MEIINKCRDLISPAVVQALIMKKSGLVKDRKKGLTKYKQSFLGSEAVDWLVQNLNFSTPEDAVAICAKLPIKHGKKDAEFKNEPTLYSFVVSVKNKKNKNNNKKKIKIKRK